MASIHGEISDFCAPVLSGSIPMQTHLGKANMPRLDFSHRVALELASVPEVLAVFTSELNGRDCAFFVWVVVPERNYDVYEKIFQKQQSIIDQNIPLRFDFTIMPSRGKDPSGLITDPCARLVYLR
jgi:hypothetical protein